MKVQNITKFIRENEELSKLPFLVVFRTIEILISLGIINQPNKKSNV
jgi:hypothetical protein